MKKFLADGDRSIDTTLAVSLVDPAENIEFPEHIDRHIGPEDTHGIELLPDHDLLHAVERIKEAASRRLVLEQDGAEQDRYLLQSSQPREGQDLRGAARLFDISQ